MSVKLEGVVTHCPDFACANACQKSSSPGLFSRHTSRSVICLCNYSSCYPNTDVQYMIIGKSSLLITVFNCEYLGLNQCFDYFQYTHLSCTLIDSYACVCVRKCLCVRVF